MSRLITNAIRSTSASADAITMDGSGNVTFPADATCSGNATISGNATFSGNVTCSGTATGFGGGKLLDISQIVKKDRQTRSSTAFGDITNFEGVVTPSASSNKILISSFISFGCHGASAMFKLFRKIGSGSYAEMTDFRGNANGAHRVRCTFNGGNTGAGEMDCVTCNILDSPNTTDEVRYKWQMATTYSASTISICGSRDNHADNAYYATTISTMTLYLLSA